MSPVASWKEWWIDVHDKQRLERLQQCSKIQERLEACQKGQAEESNIDIEYIVPGLRMMKYFGWRGIHKAPENSDELNQQISTVVSKTCAREQHALWACRAVAVGCGLELGNLKRCFDEEGPMSVLSNPQNQYEGKAPKSRKGGEIPCGGLQQQVGQCVNTGLRELDERERDRKSIFQNERSPQ